MSVLSILFVKNYLLLYYICFFCYFIYVCVCGVVLSFDLQKSSFISRFKMSGWERKKEERKNK